jgi:hypothetical protein
MNHQGTKAPRFLAGTFLLCLGCFSSAAEVDTSKLPPPAPRQISFTSDIKPILEGRCIRCHGTEKPKNKFSLASRETALRGGENGVDIIPGDSAKSPLIHYVARLVPDLEMPPPGKGDPLSASEIALLRAWIDQGVAWEPIDTSARYAAHFSFAPAVRWTTTSGNAQRFQEHQWVERGATGGSEFHLGQKFTNGAAFFVEGHALTDDYKIIFDLRKDDLGFARLGFEQFRHYYDDRGPYYPFRASGFATLPQSQFDLHKDLHLDDGKAFAEFGLTIPDWPRVLLGYEFQYRNGTKSTEQWGPVTQVTGGTNFTRQVFPAWKELNEDVHILKLDVAHDIAGTHVENNMRAEFYDLKTTRVNDTAYPGGANFPAAFTRTKDTHDQLMFANTLRGERELNKWLFVSAGYLFTEVDADATLNQSTSDALSRQTVGSFWNGDVVLKQSSHVVNANAFGGPWDGLSAALGVQSDFTAQEGFGQADHREGDPNDPTVGFTPDASLVRNDLDKTGVDETLALRYTKIPYSVLFAEARLKQEEISRFDEADGGTYDFLRDTDNSVRWQEYRAGFDVSPLRWLAFNASYKWRFHDSDYDDRRDELPHGAPGDGYPAFIRSRDSESHLFDTRLVLKPAAWIKATLSYQLVTTDYRTRTDAVTESTTASPGGEVLAGESDSSIYSANLTVTPFQRFYFSTTLSYQNSRVTTHDNGSTAVAPYDGDLWSVLVSATYALARATDVTASYSFSRGRYGQNHVAGGLPLGIDYDLHGIQGSLKHTFTPDVSASLGYGFFDYNEPSAHGFNDYTAHMVFGTLAVRLP